MIKGSITQIMALRANILLEALTLLLPIILLILGLHFLPSCSDTYNKYVLTYVDEETFDHNIYRFKSSNNVSFVVVSEQVSSHNKASAPAGYETLRLGNIYELQLYVVDHKPTLLVQLRSRLSNVEKYYIHDERFDAAGESLLFWQEGKVVADIFKSVEIRGTFIKVRP